MTTPSVLTTARLDLIPATADMMRAEAAGHIIFESAINARIPELWPPEGNDDQTLAFFLGLLDGHPERVGWVVWYIVLRENDSSPRTLVGSCGFKGEPDEMGTVELGYAIVDNFQRRGYASEAVAALVEWAFSHPEVTCVVGQVMWDNVPSLKVVGKLGFVRVGDGDEPGLVRYELPRRI